MAQIRKSPIGVTPDASIRNAGACREATALLKEGQPVGSFIRGVCGLWVDGANSRAVDTIYRIKGEKRGSRPLGTTLGAEVFVEMVDPDQIDEKARRLFLDAAELVERLGSMCFIRIPIRKGSGRRLPERLTSRTADGIYWLQNWLPEGCQTTALLIAELAQRGIDLPVATSMNVSGQPELVDQGEGRAFCATHGIPIFLGDPHRTSEVQGSFPIIQVDKAGIRLVREGHFSAAMFSHLLAGWEIDLTGFKPAKYPLRATHREPAVRALSPARLRAEMTARLDA